MRKKPLLNRQKLMDQTLKKIPQQRSNKPNRRTPETKKALTQYVAISFSLHLCLRHNSNHWSQGSWSSWQRGEMVSSLA